MATKVFMEALSPTMEEGRLVKWLKNEGDAVKSGDPLAEVETDKAIMELVARGDGVLRKRLINEGDTVAGRHARRRDRRRRTRTSTRSSRGAGSAAPAAAPPPPRSRSSRQQATAGARRMPRTRRRVAGRGQHAAAAAGRRRTARALRRAPQPPRAAAAARAGARCDVRSSPLARRLASERGLDLGRCRAPARTAASSSATSKRGRGRRRRSRAPRLPPRRARRVIPREGDFQDVPLTQIRKTIAKRLGESIGPIPTFYLTAEFDLTRVMEMRDGDGGARRRVQGVGQRRAAQGDRRSRSSQHPEVNAHWLGDKSATSTACTSAWPSPPTTG